MRWSRPRWYPIPVRSSLFLCAIFVTLSFAGCVDGSGKSVAPGGPNVELDQGAISIRGLVMDDELVPIAGASIVDAGSDRTAMTDLQGVFVLGPLEEGQHALTASKAGYESVSLAVQVFNEPVDGIRFLLSAVATDVPYHETTNHVTFVNCASYNPIGGLPCTKLVDYVAGTSLSPEESFAFPFQVPSPGLADMLIEMTWTPQAFASDMLFKMQTPPGQPATALSQSYFAMEGGKPLRGWVTANIDNDGEDGGWAVFDAEPKKVTYEGMTIWSDNNATIPGVPGVLSGWTFYFNHRAETWMTFFYNRPGTRDYTALPDE
jgi:hypothetical protein